MSKVLIVGGTAGIGRELAAFFYGGPGHTVIVAGRDKARAERAAAELEIGPAGAGSSVTGIAADLADPAAVKRALGDIDHVDHLVLAGMERDRNTVAAYDPVRATLLVTAKIVGYTTAVHALASRMPETGSVLLFGGRAKDLPYPGSTTVTAVNAAIVGLVSTLAAEIAPIRVNAIHAGPVGDSPYWLGNEAVLESARRRTLTGRLTTMADVVDGCVFLLRNPAADGVNLDLDGGWK